MNWDKVAESLSHSANKQLTKASDDDGFPLASGHFTAGLVLAALAIALSEGLEDASTSG